MGSFPRTVNEIIINIRNRKDALRKALTTDVERFYAECNPERDNLCLYGDSDGNWSVDKPSEEVPPELPEPCLGINFARDGKADSHIGVKRARHNSGARRKLQESDITTALKGRRAELFWPDDGTWYSVTINAINVKKRMSTIQYDTGETEELDLTEVIGDEQMYLLD